MVDTLADIVSQVRLLAALNPDFVYESTEAIGMCLYLPVTDEDGVVHPGCIMGQALTALGVSEEFLAEHEGETIETLIDDMHLSETPDGPLPEMAWLKRVQSAQDGGNSWREAVQWADKEEG